MKLRSRKPDPMNISQADPPLDPDSHSGSGDESTPRWVKVFGIIALVLILLVVILHLTGNSLGGPMGHGMQLP